MQCARPFSVAAYSTPPNPIVTFRINPCACSLSSAKATSCNAFFPYEAMRSSEQARTSTTRRIKIARSNPSSSGSGGSGASAGGSSFLERSDRSFLVSIRCEHTTAISNKFKSTETQRMLHVTLFAVDNPDSTSSNGTTVATSPRMALENVFRNPSTCLDSHSSARSGVVFGGSSGAARLNVR